MSKKRPLFQLYTSNRPKTYICEKPPSLQLKKAGYPARFSASLRLILGCLSRTSGFLGHNGPIIQEHSSFGKAIFFAVTKQPVVVRDVHDLAFRFDLPIAVSGHNWYTDSCKTLRNPANQTE